MHAGVLTAAAPVPHVPPDRRLPAEGTALRGFRRPLPTRLLLKLLEECKIQIPGNHHAAYVVVRGAVARLGIRAGDRERAPAGAGAGVVDDDLLTYQLILG